MKLKAGISNNFAIEQYLTTNLPLSADNFEIEA